MADYHYLLGCLYEVASRPQRALVEFTNALACDPDHEAAKLARVKMIAEAGNEKQAIAEFSRLIEAKRDWADAYYYRARVFVATKRHDQAIADCNAAIRLAADRPYPYAERGYAWSLKGDLARADADYSEAVRLDPKNAENLIFRADVREKLAKYPEAIADWRAAIELDPKSADAYRGLGRILSICPEAKLRDSDAAIEAARKACELTDWKDVDSVCVLAKALMRAGKYEEGLEQDKRALFLLQQRLAQLIDKYPRLQAIVAASESDNPPIEANQANQQALSDRCSLAETAAQCSKSTCCTRRGWRRGMFGRRRCCQP